MPYARLLAVLLALTIAPPLAAADHADAPKAKGATKAKATHKPSSPAAKAATPKTSTAPAKPQATGDVTRAQMRTEIRRTFTRADTNHDGFMSRQEFAVRMGVVLNSHPGAATLTKDQAQTMLDAANQAFNDVDTNHDGKLSLGEASRRPLTAFDRMDANHDGILTLAEKAAAHRATAEAVVGPTSGDVQGPVQ